ncbi:ELWxxDGT repeat protein [Halotia branconii]|uniref:Calx-beta domain-containing protein n=1 Tax=Halotia branconii CENA392 TaxID=1539056 RepID=A0AAJ6NWT0_9CYAN|nr:ELWxxDGT repeat protein [Halotia branconii]WGV28052.1 Calx-beta domain-containing protein [Halotia branconii CENA392]
MAKPYLVNDITPGSDDSNISYLTNANGTLYFFTYFNLEGDEYLDYVGIRLWTSDGTKPGTKELKDISPVFVFNREPQGLTNFNGIFYFLTDGYKLWRSNGTPEGTFSLVNFTGDRFTPPRLLANINGTLYFSVLKTTGDYYEEYHYDLWKSDGTTAGTFRVKELDNFVRIDSSTNVGSILYFTIYDQSYYQFNNTEQITLWRSDGTEEGTIPVKEFRGGYDDNGINYVDLRNLTTVNNIFYFTYADELWKSDGTEVGTVKVKDIATSYLRNINGTLYFVAEGDYELWKSDGTQEGTVLVKDIKPGTSGSFYSGSSLLSITNIDDILYFYADDGTYGRELWKSDGTEEGTVLVKDIKPGKSGSSQISSLTNVDGILYFIADDGIHGEELWKSDGTTAGTVLVKDIKRGSGGSQISSITNVDGILYFVANDGIYGKELWKSDGTAQGTVLVGDIKPGAGSSNIFQLTNVDGILYFTANDGINGYELWALNTNTPVVSPIVSITAIDANAAEAGNDPAVFRISRIGNLSAALTVIYSVDGTAINGNDYNKLSETVTIAAGESFVDITITPFSDTFPEGSETVNLTLFDQYYAVDPSANTASAIITDDTSAVVLTQPYLVKDIYPGAASSYSSYSYLTKVNDILYFSANDGIHGTELWKSDGTKEGTVLIKDIKRGSGGSNPNIIQINVDGIVYFTTYDSNFKLWKSDSTEEGTVLVKDFPKSSSGVYSPINVNGILYFYTSEYSSSSSDYNLWKTDGTSVGTVKLKTSSESFGIIGVNDTTYFTSYDETYGRELWKTDGTIAGTVRVKDINQGSDSSRIFINLLSINNILYFSADDGVHGEELWKSDGTEEGTVLVKDINPGSAVSPAPSNLINFNGTLYFSADDGIHGNELWKSDGTEEGTVLVKDINPGKTSGINYSIFTDVNGILYFFANYDIDSNELWKSDGTEEGTVLVKELPPGSSFNLNDSNPTGVNGIFYFTDGDTLWKSDGTEGGTFIVKDINPESSRTDYDYKINDLVDVNGTLYFSAEDGIHGRELWKSDGTTEGTVLVKDLNLGATGSNPRNLTYLNDTLYFTADDGIHGNELWAIKISDVINGDGSRDPLTGTEGSDRIVGGTGSKTITGGAGNDEFVYTSLREVGHRIADFTVGSDKIVLTQLLDSLVTGGYNGSNAFADGYVRVLQGSNTNSTVVEIDRDGIIGSAVFRLFIQLDNVTPQAMNDISNFVF